VSTVARLHLNVAVQPPDPRLLPSDRTQLTLRTIRAAGEGVSPGHSWLSLEYHDPSAVPDEVPEPSRDLLRSGGTSISFGPYVWPVPLNPFNSYVDGGVAEPTDWRGAQAVRSYELTQPQVNQFLNYVNAHRRAQFSLYFFNCGTFAEEAVKASGHVSPRGSETSWTPAAPQEMYRSILALKEKGESGAETTPLRPGEIESLHASAPPPGPGPVGSGNR
jgi:hypothetical protein